MFQDLIAERNVLRYVDFLVPLEDIVIVQRIVLDSDIGREFPLFQLLDNRSSFNISLLDYTNKV
jgi:hypothetical protein